MITSRSFTSELPERLQAKFLAKRMFSNERIFSLSFILLLLYTLMGYCLAARQNNLWLTLSLAILPIYYWCLASAIVSNTKYLFSIVGSTLIIIGNVSVTYISKPNLTIANAAVIGLTIAIYSLLLVKIIAKRFDRFLSIALPTVISWLGIAIGWIVYFASN
ncbi:MAG: hypothetical protein ACRC2V_08695 [Xenococcaceae cyanobacterium]